jgi:outer membrane protein TolC
MEAARAPVRAEAARTRRVDWDARAQALEAFLELWMNQKMSALINEQLTTLERMKAAAKARYSAGMMMGHHDFLRAEAELATMRAEKAALESEREAMAAMLNALRGWPLCTCPCPWWPASISSAWEACRTRWAAWWASPSRCGGSTGRPTRCS